MKILKFIADNFKKLSAVEITPDGNVVIISGKNAAGKSSVLDGIEASLRGGRCLPKQPIKTGEHRAKVETVLGEDEIPEYKVTRKFLGTSSTLKVETYGETKSEIRSPQAFLDKIVGDISFDPLAFMKKSSTEQRNALMDFLGLNLDEFDNKVASLKSQRSDVRKEKERNLHEADSITFTPNLPEVEQSCDPLLADLEIIRIHNKESQKISTENAVQECRIQQLNEDIAAANKALIQWQNRLKTLTTRKAETLGLLQADIPTKNPAEVEVKIKALGDTNEAIRQNARKKVAMATHDRCVAEYQRFGEEVKIVENNKARKMAETVMPIEGLTIQSDGLGYNGLPLEQECDSKKLKICVAIAMALNPKLKVLRISGNDLDNNSLAIIGELVADKDYQVWIEKVSDDNKIGFFIEDGHFTGAQNDSN